MQRILISCMETSAGCFHLNLNLQTLIFIFLSWCKKLPLAKIAITCAWLEAECLMDTAKRIHVRTGEHSKSESKIGRGKIWSISQYRRPWISRDRFHIESSVDHGTGNTSQGMSRREWGRAREPLDGVKCALEREMISFLPVHCTCVCGFKDLYFNFSSRQRKNILEGFDIFCSRLLPLFSRALLRGPPHCFPFQLELW